MATAAVVGSAARYTHYFGNAMSVYVYVCFSDSVIVCVSLSSCNQRQFEKKCRNRQRFTNRQHMRTYIHTFMYICMYECIFKHDFAFVIFYILYPVEFDILYIKCFRFGIE